MEESGPNYDQKFVCLDIPRQNISNKVKKPIKI